MSEIKDRVKYVEDVLRKYLPEAKGYQKTIFNAMEYSLMGGGKRLRPVIMNEVYRLCGGTDDIMIEPFMAALEMIHTYSLVHDDLPAMDDDDYRRGRKTTHIVYGEDIGILAGDALLNYAYETAARSFSDVDNLRKTSRAFSVLAAKAGVYGMVGGQVVDVEVNGDIPDMDMLEFIYRNKTSALLEAAFMIGGILAGADDAAVDTFEKIAGNIGMAFQIRDDILDVTGTAEVLGKPVGSDAKNDKITYATFKGIEEAEAAVRSYTDEAVSLFDELSFGEKGAFLRGLLISLIDRDR